MKPNNIRIFVFCFTVFLTSCGNTKKDIAKEKTNKAINDLALKYNADTEWDSNHYTFYYQKMFIEENKPMFFRGRIYDIEKANSDYVVKILDEREDALHNFLALITVTSQQLDSIFAENKSHRGVFVIQVSKVSSSNPSVKEDVRMVEGGEDDRGNTYEEEEHFTYLSDDADRMITIFKGKLIDMRLEEIKEGK